MPPFQSPGFARTPARLRAPAPASAPVIMRAPTPMSACVFTKVDASPIETHGALTLLHWVNRGPTDAMIQYAQGEGALIVSVEVNGRVVRSSTEGEARMRFDDKMPVVPPQGEVRIMVKRVSASSAPGAQLGVFGASLPRTGGVHTGGGLSAPATVATTTLPPVASSQPVPVAPVPAAQSGPGVVAKAMDVLWMGCFVAVPVGGVMYLAGKKDLGKKVAKVGAIGALAPVAVAVGYLALWGLSGVVKK